MNKYYSDRIKFLSELNDRDEECIKSMMEAQNKYGLHCYDRFIEQTKSKIKERNIRIEELVNACEAIELGKYADRYYDESDYIMIIRDSGTLHGYKF